MLGGKTARAFTLIEVMASLAMLAIFLSVPMAADSIHFLNQESDYRFAVRNARHQLAQMGRVSFDSLPPERVRVGTDGWVQLSHSDRLSFSRQ